ncbi:MAG: hypothetical protein IJQ68_04205 [Methanobrevibacter sp.]|uniref:hypothetical protein n=1 Tax=Methanobrevibacter sp. TaxID=66852 RepID=UPI0025EBA1B0|nr:hypothetical protein [Methanobrevibacter sp.]MBR0271180.1 hypothetical protein [Methanobrevibacter sp.]
MSRKLIFAVICIAVIVLGIFVFDINFQSETDIVNNTTNSSVNITNWTLDESDEPTQSQQSSQSVNEDPEYNSDEYIQRWDESQQGGDSWAYTHSQPTMTDDDGHSYKRMYNPDTGEIYWGSLG